MRSVRTLHEVIQNSVVYQTDSKDYRGAAREGPIRRPMMNYA
jgi:hypothetical protein